MDEQKWTDYDNFTVINQDTTWSGSLVFNDINKPIAVVDGATLTIEKGARIELFQLHVFYGRLVAEGSAQEKIVFTRATPDLSSFGDDYNPECFNYQNGLIEFDDWSFGEGMEPSFMRYVEFNNMGSFKFIDQELCSQGMSWNKKLRNFFLNTAYAQTSIFPDVINPALSFRSGQLHLENCSFSNNAYSDIEANFEVWDGWPESYLEIVNTNFSGNTQETALIGDVKRYSEDGGGYVQDKSKIVLKNNWYGVSSGPRIAPDYIIGGERLEGDYTLEGFKTKELIADPVIILPGILGSTKILGEWRLDPILQNYKNLIESFKKNGFEKEKNLFEFPYEWRNSNAITAEELESKIETIKNDTKISKVDLVGHSMGGLVAREYIENLDQKDDVDQLITLGTPQKGAPESYLKWEAGENQGNILDVIAKKIFQLEAKHAGYSDLGEYIRAEVLSVGELLPIYDYLIDVSTGETRSYPSNYPRNNFLEILNNESNLNNLNKVNFVNIFGDTDSNATIEKFRVADSSVSGSWEHGMPENFYDPSTDQGIEYGQGDETVPLESAEGISADESIEIDSSHSDLPTKAQCYVIKSLTGEDDCEYVSTFDRIKSILTFGVFSPVDIQVISPSGKRIGKNFETGETYNEIDGAYYTGYDTENEFLTIPNPENGEYKVITQGTGSGYYKIEIDKISENENGETQEISGELDGTAITGEQKEETAQLTDEEIITQKPDATPPVIEVSSPENKIYRSDEIIPITFAVSDDDSGVAEEKTKIFLNGENYSQNNINMAYLNKGEHSLKVLAEDQAGNLADKIVTFMVQPTINSVINNIDHYYQDKFIIKKSAKNYLEAKLRVIKNLKMVYDSIKFSYWSGHFKSKILERLANHINHDIDKLINDIQNKKSISQTILQPAKNILIGNLEELKVE